jgi:outer membrane lipoprotein-sorting protein
MKRFLLAACPLALALALASAASVQAADTAQARAIVDKAIQAKGLKPDAAEMTEVWKETGKMTVQGQSLEYVADWTFQPPNKYRFVMEAKFQGQPIKMTVIMNGEQAWESADGMTQEITAKKLTAMKDEVYGLWVTSLLPLRDPAFKLSLLPESQVDGKPVQGVRVSRDGRRDVSLYFDRETGLLVKYEAQVLDEFQNWKEVKDEAIFSAYKEASGVKCFTTMKLIRDDKPLIEATLSDHKRLAKADAKMFEKP